MRGGTQIAIPNCLFSDLKHFQSLRKLETEAFCRLSAEYCCRGLQSWIKNRKAKLPQNRKSRQNNKKKRKRKENDVIRGGERVELPEGHLEYLSQVDLLGFVVVSVQHLPKQGVIEVDILPRAFGSLAVVGLQETGASIFRQTVLLHTPWGSAEKKPSI